jgi:hypothetical protein
MPSSTDIHAYTTYLKKTFPPQNNSPGAYYEHMAALQSTKDQEAYMIEMERIDQVFNVRQFEQRQEELYNIKKKIEEASIEVNCDYSSDDNEYDDDDDGFETVKRR